MGVQFYHDRYIHFKFAHVLKLKRSSACLRARERSLEQRSLKLMHAWELWTMTNMGRLLTDGTVKSCTVVEFRAMRNDTHKRQRFSSL